MDGAQRIELDASVLEKRSCDDSHATRRERGREGLGDEWIASQREG